MSSSFPATPIHPKYRPDIDGLRAIAVLLVVVFHAFPDWASGGFIGVDIFFVISGFLISSIILEGLKNDTFRFTEFYGRRIRRIFPALILIMTASFILGWLLLLPAEYKQLGKHMMGGASFVSNFVFWNESGYFDNSPDTKPLLHLWSLGVEEQFYFVWPLLLWLAWRNQVNLLKTTIVIAVVSFSLNIVQAVVYFDGSAAFYSPQTRFWELSSGSILALIQKHGNKPFFDLRRRINRYFQEAFFLKAPLLNGETWHSIQAIFGISLITIGVIVTTKEKAFPGWLAILPTLGAVLIISAGPNAWINRLALSNRAMVWIGLISFPLYLWHWPLLSFIRIAEGKVPSAEFRIAAVATSIVLASLTYLLLEKPIRLGWRSGKTTPILIISMIAVGYLGYECMSRDGMEFRFPTIVKDLMGYKYSSSEIRGKAACFLAPSQDYSAFHNCEWPNDKGKKTLLLWGDSNAEHLYAGYKTSFGSEFEIITRTASLCPPIINMEIELRPHCKKINDYIFQLIEKKRPDKIVLAAIWNEYDWKEVESTITRLRNIGITDIDLIGPAPRWVDSLPRLLYIKYRSDVLRRIPERMDFGLRQDVIQLDTILSDFSQKLSVNYISPIKILCNGNGCITRLGKTGDTLTAYDHVHLTTKGSQFLVSKFPKSQADTLH